MLVFLSFRKPELDNKVTLVVIAVDVNTRQLNGDTSCATKTRTGPGCFNLGFMSSLSWLSSFDTHWCADEEKDRSADH